MKQQVKYAAMSWYHRDDYEKLRSIFTDSHVLPKTFEKWLQLAEDGFKNFTRQGLVVEKVYIDPDTFPAWCNARGLNVDAKARVKFANDFVGRKYLGKN